MNQNSGLYCNNIGQAWHNFVRKGHIGDCFIRPEILRSWQRSSKLDPYTVDPHPTALNEYLLKKKCCQNSDLLAVARPIMQYLYSFSNESYIMLCDKDGYVIEKNYPFEFPYTIGRNLRDEELGATSVGIALYEDTYIKSEGFENYAIRYHTYSCAACPIHDRNGKIIGVISIMNPFGQISDNALQLVVLATQIIEKQLVVKPYIKIENEAAFLAMIDSLRDCVVILDKEGSIKNVNQGWLNIFNSENSEAFIGKSIGKYTTDKSFTSDILGNKSYRIQKEFSLKVSDELAACSLINKYEIKNLAGGNNTVLLFKTNVKNNTGKETNKFSFPYCKHSVNIDNLIGETANWKKVKEIVYKVAKVKSTTILIEGESGTGKELVAQAIHNESGRQGKFIALNCGAIPKELLQSELFGYEEGAFTGARKGGSTGKIESADGGTLFLDEIGEMPLDMQVSLLRILEDKAVTRLGANKSVKVDINVISATNRNLKDAVNNGKFREDLYYRLSVINITLPPLKERKEDIPLIVNSLMKQISTQLNIEGAHITNEAIELLKRYDWPGNVRELKNIIEQALILSPNNCISTDLLPDYLEKNPWENECFSYEKSSESSDLEMILEILKKNNGNIKKTAEELGMARNTLYKRVDKFDLFLARNSNKPPCRK